MKGYFWEKKKYAQTIALDGSPWWILNRKHNASSHESLETTYSASVVKVVVTHETQTSMILIIQWARNDTRKFKFFGNNCITHSNPHILNDKWVWKHPTYVCIFQLHDICLAQPHVCWLKCVEMLHFIHMEPLGHLSDVILHPWYKWIL